MLIEDPAGRFLNDKNSMTADPNDSDFVYAVWDRLQEARARSINPENRVGRGSRARSASPAPRTAATRGSRRARSTRPARTSRRSATRSSSARRASSFDFFGDITNRSNRRDGIGPVKLSFIVSDDRGATWTKPDPRRRQTPMTLFRERHARSTSSRSRARTRPTRARARSAAATCIPEVAVDAANGKLYAVWMDARFDGGFLATTTASRTRQSTDGGATWSPPIQVNQTPRPSRTSTSRRSRPRSTSEATAR